MFRKILNYTSIALLIAFYIFLICLFDVKDVNAETLPVFYNFGYYKGDIYDGVAIMNSVKIGNYEYYPTVDYLSDGSKTFMGSGGFATPIDVPKNSYARISFFVRTSNPNYYPSLYFPNYDSSESLPIICQNVHTTSGEGLAYYYNCYVDIPYSFHMFTVMFNKDSNNSTVNFYVNKNYFIYSKAETTTDSILQQQLEEQQKTNDAINELDNKQQETNNKLDDVNNNITSSETSDPSESFEGFNSSIADSGAVTQLYLLPVTLWTKVATSVNSTCKTVELGSLYGTELTMSCIDISNFIGKPLFSVIDVIISGFMLFKMSKSIIKVFEHLSTLKEDSDILD